MGFMAVTIVMLQVVAACGGGGADDRPAPPASPPVSSSAPPVPLTTAEYEAWLASVEDEARPVLDRVLAAGTLAEVEAARLDLAAILERHWDYGHSITPPTDLRDQHDHVTTAIFAWQDLREYASSNAVTEPNSCGLTAASDTQLHEAKANAYYTVKSSSFKVAVEELAAVGIAFGERMLPARPEAPPLRDRRAGNGEVVQRTGSRGSGRLDIDNGTKFDVAVSVVTGKPSEPEATIYVREGDQATLTGIRGKYEVYFESGSDWDAKRRGFTRNCSFERFDEPFRSNSHWQIKLEKTPIGNATTSEVDPF